MKYVTRPVLIVIFSAMFLVGVCARAVQFVGWALGVVSRDTLAGLRRLGSYLGKYWD